MLFLPMQDVIFSLCKHHIVAIAVLLLLELNMRNITLLCGPCPQYSAV